MDDGAPLKLGLFLKERLIIELFYTGISSGRKGE